MQPVHDHAARRHLSLRHLSLRHLSLRPISLLHCICDRTRRMSSFLFTMLQVASQKSSEFRERNTAIRPDPIGTRNTHMCASQAPSSCVLVSNECIPHLLSNTCKDGLEICWRLRLWLYGTHARTRPVFDTGGATVFERRQQKNMPYHET